MKHFFSFKISLTGGKALIIKQRFIDLDARNRFRTLTNTVLTLFSFRRFSVFKIGISVSRVLALAAEWEPKLTFLAIIKGRSSRSACFTGCFDERVDAPK